MTGEFKNIFMIIVRNINVPIHKWIWIISEVVLSAYREEFL